MIRPLPACILSFLVPLVSLAADRPDLARIFDDAGYPTGTMLVYDLKQNTTITIHPDRANDPLLPASTFKIFNSLVGLETGVLKDEHVVIPWDGVKREFESWNRDHDLQSAIAVSCLPYFQEVARRIGRDRMQHWIDAAHYGNQKISPKIDSFWLDGDLRISADQQLELLIRLYKNDLPFSQRSMDIVKRILITEQTSDCTLHSKTGWAHRTNPDIGWWVGWVERSDGNVYFFASNIRAQTGDKEFAADRTNLPRTVLRKLAILPPDQPAPSVPPRK